MLGGKLGDRFGRKRMFLAGLGIFTAMSVACALAPTVEWLVAFRAGQGVGGALMNPLTLSIIVAAFPRKELGSPSGSGPASRRWPWRSDRCSAESWWSTLTGRPSSGSTRRRHRRAPS